jgi:hypothetical protein
MFEPSFVVLAVLSSEGTTFTIRARPNAYWNPIPVAGKHTMLLLSWPQHAPAQAIAPSSQTDDFQSCRQSCATLITRLPQVVHLRTQAGRPRLPPLAEPKAVATGVP